MKTYPKKQTLTFGEFITGIYDICGKRKARQIVRLAVKTHIIEFRGHQNFVMS